MTIRNIDSRTLISLLESVFKPSRSEPGVAILVDIPRSKGDDSKNWADRRRIAAEWYTCLSDSIEDTPFQRILICTYDDVGSNNNDLPENVVIAAETNRSTSAAPGTTISLEKILAEVSIVLALTEFSATAPLKVLARKFRFRGATLPGFTRQMLPTLGLDYGVVNTRVMQFKERLDRSEQIDIDFIVESKSYSCAFDTRFRSGHASSGLIPEPGSVGNLPSGEAYIVPYEGEEPSEPSRTRGEIPVQFGNEVVVYHVEGNRAVKILTQGNHSTEEARRLTDEPAYGNIAEIGIGILDEFGVKPVGSTLLDEKLGLHIAFGRSEHFGGITGPEKFRLKSNIVHIDRIYIQSLQPKVLVKEVLFSYKDGSKEVVMKDGRFVV